MAKDTTENQEVQEQETATLEPKHVGFGRYDVDGQRFESKDAALAYIEAKKAEAADEEEFGAQLPDGYDISITEQPYIYRGSLMELPMNERYAPDGSFNPYYDRQWVWGWAAHVGTDISEKQAKGYRLVTLEEIEAGIKEDKIPPHVRNMVREEGSYLVFGDSVLMRMPRVLKRQRDRAQFEKTMARMKRLDEQQRDAFDKAGVGVSDKSQTGSNELDIRF